jgi:hypothetical protein
MNPTTSQVPATAQGVAYAGALHKIERYPFAQVREKLLMEGRFAPEVIDQAIPEFRKYLSLLAMGYSGLGMISKEVDEVWHTFILFTRDYSRFCEEVFGFYLHHHPGLDSQPIGPEPRKRFLEAYQSVYGAIPPIYQTNAKCGTCGTPSTACQDPKCK